MARSDPTANPSAARRRTRAGVHSGARGAASKTNAAAHPIANSVNGSANRCACGSANRKVKKGNSVISQPGGSGGIMRLARQKSKSGAGKP